jgi:hypothetical protein
MISIDYDLFEPGVFVRKKKGYAFPGRVLSVFRTEAGELRCVVEMWQGQQGATGMLHIFNIDQLELSQQ